MNSLRLRIVLLSHLYGVGTDYNYALQISFDGLNWWTLSRFKSLDEALGPSKDLLAFINTNRIVKEDKIIWTAKVD